MSLLSNVNKHIYSILSISFLLSFVSIVFFYLFYCYIFMHVHCICECHELLLVLLN